MTLTDDQNKLTNYLCSTKYRIRKLFYGQTLSNHDIFNKIRPYSNLVVLVLWNYRLIQKRIYTVDIL